MKFIDKNSCQTPEFKEYVESIISKNGNITISKQAGLFICTK